nr:unnamed protein product [Callosobruchus analis]
MTINPTTSNSRSSHNVSPDLKPLKMSTTGKCIGRRTRRLPTIYPNIFLKRSGMEVPPTRITSLRSTSTMKTTITTGQSPKRSRRKHLQGAMRATTSTPTTTSFFPRSPKRRRRIRSVRRIMKRITRIFLPPPSRMLRTFLRNSRRRIGRSARRRKRMV